MNAYPASLELERPARPRYRPWTLRNIDQLEQFQGLPEELRFAVRVVGEVLPFRTNNYVVEQLIDWNRVPDDPMFILNFPQRDMLLPHHFDAMARLVRAGASPGAIRQEADRIRLELRPHPAGQLEANRPSLRGHTLKGMQHKYRETVLFFPSQGQTCHAYCSFCFRWPQFVGMDELKIAMNETDALVDYLRRHPEVTDVLFTGGDPLIMRTKTLATYIEALLEARLPSLRSIRIGSKALSYWPYRFLTDPDAGELLDLFSRVTDAGVNLALMAHFNHPRELSTTPAHEAIAAVRRTGATIRTQSPLLAHINDDPALWARMWKEQVRLGCVPYYMFVVRDTGAQHYFGLSLDRAWRLFREAYQQVSGLARTVRGPSMSAFPGKVQVVGVTEVQGERVFALRMLQGRNPDWALRPFFARHDPEAIWLDDLEPALGEERFFFQDEAALAAT